MEKCEVFDRVVSCKIELGVVRRNARYLIELRAVRSLLEEVFVRCEEFVRRNGKYPIELGVVRRLLEEI